MYWYSLFPEGVVSIATSLIGNDRLFEDLSVQSACL
jgi:hypothetical protein